MCFAVPATVADHHVVVLAPPIASLTRARTTVEARAALAVVVAPPNITVIVTVTHATDTETPRRRKPNPNPAIVETIVCRVTINTRTSTPLETDTIMTSIATARNPVAKGGVYRTRLAPHVAPTRLHLNGDTRRNLCTAHVTETAVGHESVIGDRLPH